MKPQRPYLLRALYEWIVDSDCTPHLLADAGVAGVSVPPEAVQDGRIVLNIAPRAVRGLAMGDEAVEFECRFGGVPRHVVLPVGSILAIYARENGAGMAFEAAAQAESEASAEQDTGEPGGDQGDDDEPPPRGGGHLRVVK